MAIEELLDNMEESMMNAEDAMKTDIAAIRTGKASTALVEGLMVEYYGTIRAFATSPDSPRRMPAPLRSSRGTRAPFRQLKRRSSTPISEFLRSATARLCVCRFRR